MYSSEGSEAGTVDDTEVGQGAHCSAAKYGVLVERSECALPTSVEKERRKRGKVKLKKGKTKLFSTFA